LKLYINDAPDEVENIEDIDRVKKKNLKKNWQKRNLGFFRFQKMELQKID